MLARAAAMVVFALGLLGCQSGPAGMPLTTPTTVSPLAPTPIDGGAKSTATVVSWSCLTSGADWSDFSANGWTIKREPCSSTSTGVAMNGVRGASVFAPEFAPAPTNLRATLIGTTVQLDWDQPPTASAWQVEAGSGAGLSNIAVFRTTSRTVRITGVANGTYFVRVRSAAPDFSDVSLPSNEITVFVPECTACCLAAPGSFSALVNGNSVMLSWYPPPGSDVASYVLGVGSTPNRSDLIIFDTRSAATSLQATAPNGLFYARIHAKSPCGLSGASDEVTIVVPSAPPPLPAAPVADFSFARYAAGLTCSYRGCLFDATRSTGSGLTYFWDFADGSTGTGLYVLHIYARPPFVRQMTVVLTVTDAFGRTSTRARDLYLNPNY